MGEPIFATKLGDLVVQLESGEHSRCGRLGFQVSPDIEFNDIRRGIEAEGLRCQLTQRLRARHCANAFI